MTIPFKVNTHHAFLNTEIVLSSELPFVEIMDNLTGTVYQIKSSPINVKLCAGKHNLYCHSYDYEVVVEVEDAIKLGGGKVNQAFVFDNNPWIFVLTKDRMYATNIDTKEEQVEYNLVPDEIQAFNNYGSSPCEYFLLRTKQDYSIYNVRTGVHVIRFSDHIFSNSHLVIFRKEENVIVFNYRTCNTIKEIREQQYSIGDNLYFVEKGKLFECDLNNDNIKQLSQVGIVSENCVLANNYLLKIVEDKQYAKTYYLFSLYNKGGGVIKTTIILPYYIESLYKIVTSEFKELKGKYVRFIEEQKKILANNKDITICCSGVKIDKIQIKSENRENLSLFGHIISYPSNAYKVPFNLIGILGSTIDFDGGSLCKEVCKTDVQENINITKSLGQIIGKSESGSRVVTMCQNRIVYQNFINKTNITLLEGLFDTTLYNNAYFSSDGKNVIFMNKSKAFEILDLEDMTKTIFEVEGSTVARLAGFNGYKPEFVIQEMSNRKPVWRDPISLRKIGEDEMSNHIFMSPNGRYSAEMQMKKKYYNRLTKQELSLNEYVELQDKYNWNKNSKDEDIKKKIRARAELNEKYEDELLFAHLFQKNEKLIKTAQADKSIEEQQKVVERLNNLGKKEYLEKTPEFTDLFVDVLGYVCYKENETDKAKRVLIGRGVWFLNYVSFSYDSRFLAFGAKMKEDTWRNSQEGVFAIYDLKEENIVVRRDYDEDLHAVWMTMFSKDGNVAYYDSHANAYVSTLSSHYERTFVAKGKSLLCFSPSGKFIALSDQNYLDYAHHKYEEWGHQPSGNIFIHSVDDLETCIEHYNDFGEGIDGVTLQTRRIVGSVASAAFSSDEKRLLAVGEDGVVVIRNLHLDDDLDDWDEYKPQEIGNMEDPHIRADERQNYTDLHVPTSDGIIEDFFCYWCGPDEKWDENQGLIISVDGKELRECIKINLKKCKIPHGVEFVHPKTFIGGLYTQGGCYENELTSIYLPSTIKEIDEEVFMDLCNLKEIIVEYGSLEKFRYLLPKYIPIMREEDDLP